MLAVGDTIEYRERSEDRRRLNSIKRGKVIAATNRFIKVDLGKYSDSILINDLKTGLVEVKQLFTKEDFNWCAGGKNPEANPPYIRINKHGIYINIAAAKLLGLKHGDYVMFGFGKKDKNAVGMTKSDKGLKVTCEKGGSANISAKGIISMMPKDWTLPLEIKVELQGDVLVGRKP
jgi:hypothetical protein